ncbi:MAG: cupredoxin family copper-binding protein [Parcubacteria group bacterium]
MEGKQTEEEQRQEKMPSTSSLTIWIVIAAIIIVAGIFYFYRGKYQAPSPSSNPSSAAPSSRTNAAQNTAAAVTIQNFTFSPASLTIKKGETVTWTNEDSVPHQIASDSGAFQGNSMGKGQSYSFTFNTTGEFDYHCAIHPSMKGKIIVQ